MKVVQVNKIEKVTGLVITIITSYLLPFTLFDAALVAAYLIAIITFKTQRLDVFKCFSPLLVYFATYKSEQIQTLPLVDIYAYLFYSAIYTLVAYHFYNEKKYYICVPLLAMGFYDAVYSFDSWVNSNVNTWIWHNHAYIICILHTFILLVFIKKFRSVVDASIDTISAILNTILSRGETSHSKARKRGEASNK